MTESDPKGTSARSKFSSAAASARAIDKGHRLFEVNCRALLMPVRSSVARGRRPVSRAGDENRSGGCKPPSLEFVSVVAVNGSTEFVEADYETRSDCHRVACDGWPSITGIRSWCPASLGTPALNPLEAARAGAKSWQKSRLR